VPAAATGYGIVRRAPHRRHAHCGFAYAATPVHCRPPPRLPAVTRHVGCPAPPAIPIHLHSLYLLLYYRTHGTHERFNTAATLLSPTRPPWWRTRSWVDSVCHSHSLYYSSLHLSPAVLLRIPRHACARTQYDAATPTACRYSRAARLAAYLAAARTALLCRIEHLFCHTHRAVASLPSRDTPLRILLQRYNARGCAPARNAYRARDYFNATVARCANTVTRRAACASNALRLPASLRSADARWQQRIRARCVCAAPGSIVRTRGAAT